MYLALSILAVLLASLILGVLHVYRSGFVFETWMGQMVGAALGACIAITGSIVIHLLQEKRQERKTAARSLYLLKKELKDNFAVCLFRITKVSDQIPFFYEVYDHLIKSGAGHIPLPGRGEAPGDAFEELYFLIRRGQYGLTTFKQFYENVFYLQKKRPRSYPEVKEIIESTGLEQVLEFAVMQYIVHLDAGFRLGLDLPFERFKKVLDFEGEKERGPHIDLVHYVTEEVCKAYFKDNRTIHYSVSSAGGV